MNGWKPFSSVVIVTACIAVHVGSGCSSDSEGEAGAPCETSSDCGSDVCVSTSNVASCAPKCALDGNECSGGLTCQGLGSFSVNVCAAKPKEASPSDPPTPEEQPRVPCKTDADCKPLDARAICAQWHGARDCTIACTSNDMCAEGPVGGVTVDFESCQTDEGNQARMACLPRAECEDRPLDCVTFSGGTNPLPGVPTIPDDL